ncbi:MAG: nitroreductase family protein [Planctomycetota bacterium]|jgi:nitroreductase
MSRAEFVPYRDRYDPGVPPEEAARNFCEVMGRRRTVRMFSDRPVSQETIEWLVRTAGSAPSGANKQPWRFVCVQDPALKRQIRLAAEEADREFYARSAHETWIKDLEPLGTVADDSYLESAPWVIAVFRLTREDDGGQVYYTSESVGLAAGFLIAAAHHAGLVSLVHTPSPMGFLNDILRRPKNERPFMLLPVGFPADDCVVPAAARNKKPLRKIMIVDRMANGGPS